MRLEGDGDQCGVIDYLGLIKRGPEARPVTIKASDRDPLHYDILIEDWHDRDAAEDELSMHCLMVAVDAMRLACYTYSKSWLLFLADAVRDRYTCGGGELDVDELYSAFRVYKAHTDAAREEYRKQREEAERRRWAEEDGIFDNFDDDDDNSDEEEDYYF